MILNAVIGLLLAMVVAFDLKSKKVPSVFTTAIILILCIVNFNNIYFGIIAFVFAWLLFEFEFISGVADIKVIVIIGLMCSSMLGIFALMIFVAIYGAIYKIAFGLILKKDAVAFTLPLLLIYFTMWILSYSIGGIF